MSSDKHNLKRKKNEDAGGLNCRSDPACGDKYTCWHVRKFTLGHSGLGSFTVFDQTEKTTALRLECNGVPIIQICMEIKIRGIDKTQR